MDDSQARLEALNHSITCALQDVDANFVAAIQSAGQFCSSCRKFKQAAKEMNESCQVWKEFFALLESKPNIQPVPLSETETKRKSGEAGKEERRNSEFGSGLIPVEYRSPGKSSPGNESSSRRGSSIGGGRNSRGHIFRTPILRKAIARTALSRLAAAASGGKRFPDSVEGRIDFEDEEEEDVIAGQDSKLVKRLLSSGGSGKLRMGDKSDPGASPLLVTSQNSNGEEDLLATPKLSSPLRTASIIGGDNNSSDNGETSPGNYVGGSTLSVSPSDSDLVLLTPRGGIQSPPKTPLLCYDEHFAHPVTCPSSRRASSYCVSSTKKFRSSRSGSSARYLSGGVEDGDYDYDAQGCGGEQELCEERHQFEKEYIYHDLDASIDSLPKLSSPMTCVQLAQSSPDPAEPQPIVASKIAAPASSSNLPLLSTSDVGNETSVLCTDAKGSETVQTSSAADTPVLNLPQWPLAPESSGKGPVCPEKGSNVISAAGEGRMSSFTAAMNDFQTPVKSVSTLAIPTTEGKMYKIPKRQLYLEEPDIENPFSEETEKEMTGNFSELVLQLSKEESEEATENGEEFCPVKSLETPISSDTNECMEELEANPAEPGQFDLEMFPSMFRSGSGAIQITELFSQFREIESQSTGEDKENTTIELQNPLKTPQKQKILNPSNLPTWSVKQLAKMLDGYSEGRIQLLLDLLCSKNLIRSFSIPTQDEIFYQLYV
eukprot:Nk52_evm29s272 gene=Nk52_evmTU29s272